MFQRVGNVIQGIYNRFKPLFNVIGVFVLFLLFNQVWDVYKDYEAFKQLKEQGNIVLLRDETLYTFEFKDLDLIKDNLYCNCYLNERVNFNTPAPKADTSTIGQNTYQLK